MRRIDIPSGEKFNELTVIDIDKDKSKPGLIFYKCKCSCGNIISVRSYCLRTGHTKSCGCLHNELLAKNNTLLKSKSNRIEFDSNLGCLKVYFNNCDEYFLCDIEDRDIAEKYCWHKGSDGYVSCNINNQGKYITVRFHRLVMEKYHDDLFDYIIDHRNHNKLDNRKSNLRKCTHSDNSKNRIFNSTIGQRYITFDKRYMFFVVQISSDNVREYFNTLEEAISFRDNYLKEHPDEFRYNPDEDYRNRDNSNIIHPFKFIDKDKVIQPFIYIKKEE